MIVAQLVRASDCGSEGHGFEPRLSPLKKQVTNDTQSLLLAFVIYELLHPALFLLLQLFSYILLENRIYTEGIKRILVNKH